MSRIVILLEGFWKRMLAFIFMLGMVRFEEGLDARRGVVGFEAAA